MEELWYVFAMERLGVARFDSVVVYVVDLS